MRRSCCTSTIAAERLTNLANVMPGRSCLNLKLFPHFIPAVDAEVCNKKRVNCSIVNHWSGIGRRPEFLPSAKNWHPKVYSARSVIARWADPLPNCYMEERTAFIVLESAELLNADAASRTHGESSVDVDAKAASLRYPGRDQGLIENLLRKSIVVKSAGNVPK
jgi:hypothetical protein